MRHQVIGFGLAETFLDGTFNPHQTSAELVFSQFTDATHATITEVINIIDFAATIAQLNQNLDDGKDVFVRQGHRADQFFTADTDD